MAEARSPDTAAACGAGAGGVKASQKARNPFDDVDSVLHVARIVCRLLLMLASTALDTLRYYAVRKVQQVVFLRKAEGTFENPEVDAVFLSGKTCLLTGITRGIGRAALQEVLALPSAWLPKRIIFLSKDASAEEAEVVAEIKARQVEVKRHHVDLAHPFRVMQAAEEILAEESELHLILCNAGVWGTEADRVASDLCGLDDGLELHFLVNFLATTLLVQTLRPLLERSSASAAQRNAGASRVVVTGSFTAFDIAGGVARLDDMQLLRRRGSVHFGFGSAAIAQAMGYSHSKLLLHMYARHLGGAILDPQKVRVVVVDPGIANTGMHAGLRFSLGPWLSKVVYGIAARLGCLRSPSEAAAPLVYCCLQRELPDQWSCPTNGATGALFCDWGKTYLRKRKPSTDMAHFQGADLFPAWFPLDGRALSPSLQDAAACKRVYQHAEDLRACLQKAGKASAVEVRRGACRGGCLPEFTLSLSWVHRFYADIMLPLVDFLPQCPPGPPLFPFRYLVNVQKGGTLPFCLLLMIYSGNYSQTALTYTALHSSYGICWLFKDAWFRDPQTEQSGSFVGLTIVFVILSIYWYMPVVVILGGIEVHAAQQAFCIGMCLVGSVLMMVADCHKYFALKYNSDLARQKKFLIDDGIFATNRNPNYLGEMILYGGFGLMTGPRLEVLVALVSIWTIVFGTNMLRKDASLAKKPGWETYSKRSHLFLFRSRPSSPCAQSAKTD